jgi:hypothetical protein
VLSRRRSIGLVAEPEQSLTLIGLCALACQTQAGPALPESCPALAQFVEAFADPPISGRTTHSDGQRRVSTTFGAIKGRPEHHLFVNIDSERVAVALAYICFPGRQPGRGEPQFRARLGWASAFSTQVQVSLSKPAVADLLIDAGFPGRRFQTMSFPYRTEKSNSSW